MAERTRHRRAAEADEKEHKRRTDAIDREVARRPIRCEPLGRDRNRNAYWWRVCEGQDAQILVMDAAAGTCAAVADRAHLDRLLGGLDERGVRERDLRTAIEAHEKALRAQLPPGPGFASVGGDAEAEEDAAPPRRGPGRPRRAAAQPNGGQGPPGPAFSARPGGDGAHLADEDAALAFVAKRAPTLARLASDAQVPPPPASVPAGSAGAAGEAAPATWKAWSNWARTAPDLSDLVAALAALEAAIWDVYAVADPEPSNLMAVDPTRAKATKPQFTWNEYIENSSSDEEAVGGVDAAQRMRRRVRARLVWWSGREREAWVEGLHACRCASALAYHAAILDQRLAVVALQGEG